MARDGAGTYTRTHADYVYGEVIDQVAVNAELNDIATALTGSLTGKFWWGGIAGGTADARTITPSPSISAYAAGQEWAFINGAAANATATPTLAINGLAPRTGKRADGSALLPGDWPANALIRVIDDGTNLRLAERVGGSFAGSIIQAEGAAVASAATTNIWANDGDTIHITGTTTITSFGTAPQAGAWKKVIFDGALTLTHGANLSLPGSANIITAAGDIAFVYADTTTQFDVLYFKKNGAAPVVTGAPTIQVFTSNGTWTKPANLSAVIIELWSAGGGGGGRDTDGAFGGGNGASGGYARLRLAASALGATETVTVTAGGAGGLTQAAPTAGSDGATTSFGSLLSAVGGGGGQASTAAAHGAGGNPAAVPGTGNVNVKGIQGVQGVALSAQNPIRSTMMGETYNFGGRGAAGDSGGAGETGGGGLIIVTEYY